MEDLRKRLCVSIKLILCGSSVRNKLIKIHSITDRKGVCFEVYSISSTDAVTTGLDTCQSLLTSTPAAETVFRILGMFRVIPNAKTGQMVTIAPKGTRDKLNDALKQLLA